MALPVQEQAKYWGIAAAVFLALLWLLGNVILPFVIGGAVAYVLDPLADRLERAGLSRALATVVITLVAALVLIVLLLAIVPLMLSQAAGLFNAVPEIFRNLQEQINTRFPQVLEENSVVRQTLATLGEGIKSRGGELIQTLVGSVSGILNIALLVVLVPVITFYLLMDWDRMIARVDDLLPRDHAPVIRRLALEINDTLAAFIRGQGTVCLILGTFYASALVLVGLQFGIVVGAVAGLISFIPYVGAIVGGALSVGLALAQFWGDWVWIIAVALIFQFGQVIEGNVLTPKLVGDSVGLHPVWLLFALSCFGSLFGFVGLLVAVPVAAMLGVIVRFLIDQYTAGRLYKGHAGRDAPLSDDSDA